jgi:hypothetical protein
MFQTMCAHSAYASGFAGYTLQQSREDLVQIEKALAELEILRSIRKLDKEQMQALNEKIRALEELVAIERQKAEAYRQGGLERKNANETDANRIKILEELVQDFKEERARLMSERDRARLMGRLYAVGGFLLGIIATLAVKK